LGRLGEGLEEDFAGAGDGFGVAAVGREVDRDAVHADRLQVRHLLTDLVAIYDAGMREPIPLPLKTGHTWASANPRSARFKAEGPWSKDRFGVENEDEAHVRVWGRAAPLSLLLEQRPQPGEDYADQKTRLGALACRLWTPILEKGRS